MIDKTLRIYGYKSTPALKEDIRKASNFFIKRLLPQKRILHVSVKRRKDLIEKSGTYGECWQLDEPHCFEILLDGELSREDCLTTLAHEFVHVKQFSRRELKFGHKIDTWCGKKYYHGAAYETLPWEKEATRLETKLYSEYQTHKKFI
jgi:hypothetical protein